MIIGVLFLFLTSVNHGAENIYTWKDKEGVVNITDQPPPPGAEIIDVSPSYRKEAEELQRERMNRIDKIRQDRDRQQQMNQLSELRKIEKEALQAAEEFMELANNSYSRAERAQDKERNRRLKSKGQGYETKYKEALARAEKAKNEAEMLEKSLGL